MRDTADEFQNANDAPETFKAFKEFKLCKPYPRLAPPPEEDGEEESEWAVHPSEVFDRVGQLPVGH